MFTEQVLGHLVILKADPVNQVLFGQVFFQSFRESFLLRPFYSFVGTHSGALGLPINSLHYTIFSGFQAFISEWLFFAIF
jgi:hypothetical protein